MIVTASRRTLKASASVAILLLLALHGYATPRQADAASDMVAQAKTNVAQYAGPQTT